MSLLTSAVYPALGDVQVLPEIDEATDVPVTTYTLTHTGSGWVLLTRRRSGWATPLAAHGAGSHASLRVAQAVGVRVLHELGVEVTSWCPTDDDGPTREVVAITTTSTRHHRPRGLRGH